MEGVSGHLRGMGHWGGLPQAVAAHGRDRHLLVGGVHHGSANLAVVVLCHTVDQAVRCLRICTSALAGGASIES